MTQKVIYISWMHLSDKVQRDWFIDYLASKGETVEYWDLVPLLFGGDKFASKQEQFLRIPKSYEEIESRVKRPENQGAKYVMLASYEGRTAKLYRLLSKHDCRMYYIAWGRLPAGRLGNWRDRFLRVVFHPMVFSKALFSRAKLVAYRALKLVKPYAVVFAAGRSLISSVHNADKVVPINLVDYDHYARVKSEKAKPTEGAFAVFLDVNLPFQTDLAIAGLPAIRARPYFESLNRFFELIEKQREVKVVVAAHPKADYGREIFHGREIYKGLTPELVRDAVFVISHHSTSICYAVLNHKPLVFVYTDEMVRAYKRTIVTQLLDLAAYLDVPCYNIDQITEGRQVVLFGVNEQRYGDYKYNFLTSPESENSSTQEIFYRELNCV